MRATILIATVITFTYFWTANAFGVKVTFTNNTGRNVFVRCIAPGGVPVDREYRRIISKGGRDSRDDFATGLRVVAAWTEDKQMCTALPVMVKDGLELVVRYDDEKQQIMFEAPCSACAAGSSEKAR